MLAAHEVEIDDLDLLVLSSLIPHHDQLRADRGAIVAGAAHFEAIDAGLLLLEVEGLDAELGRDVQPIS